MEYNYKIYRGKVTSNTDPENLGRKQIRILPYMEDANEDYLPWCKPFLNATGDASTQKYTPLPIGTKVIVLADKDDSFLSCYWMSEKHIEGLFDFDSIKDTVEGIDENSSMDLETLRFDSDPSGNIYFRNIEDGNTGTIHHSGSYVVFDADGNIILNGVANDIKAYNDNGTIELKSNGELSVENGSGDFKLSSSGQFAVNGTTFTVDP